MSPWLSDLYLRSQSDARLVSLARDGHDRAFAVLAERYRDELLGRARRLGAIGSAEDIVQQTLLSAFAALRRGAEVGHARGWLHAILRHAAIRAHTPTEAPLEAAVDALVAHDTLLETRADAREVLSALDELPARQREALIGSAMQGLSRAELAVSLGVSEGAVRQLVHRARIAVRAAVTAATPYQLARWLSDSASGGGSVPEAALGGGAAAGVGGLLAKFGMVAAAGAIAAGGAVVAEHHGARHPGARRAAVTVAADADPALHAAAGRTVGRVAVIDLTGAGRAGTADAAGRRGETGRLAADGSGPGRRAPGETRSGRDSGTGHGTGDGGGLPAGTGSSGGRDGGSSGAADGGGDRIAGQTGGSGASSGPGTQPTSSGDGSGGGDATPTAVPAATGPGTATTGSSRDGTGVLAFGTGGADRSGGSGGSSGTSGTSGSSTTTSGGSGSSGGSSTDSASGDAAPTSTN